MWYLVATLSIVQLAFGTQYIVYPKNGKNHMACATTTRFLQNYLGANKVKTRYFPVRDFTLNWAVEANEAQVSEIRNEPGVSDDTQC